MKTLKTSLLIAALAFAGLWTAQSQAQVAIAVGPTAVQVEPVRWRTGYRPYYYSQRYAYPQRYNTYRPYYRPYYYDNYYGGSYGNDYYTPRGYSYYYGW